MPVVGRREEEVGDRHVEDDGQQVELVGVESSAPVAVEAALHGRDRRLGEPMAGEPGQTLGDVLLGHPPAFPDRLDVVGDDRVDVHAVLPRQPRLGVRRCFLLGARPDHPTLHIVSSDSWRCA